MLRRVYGQVLSSSDRAGSSGLASPPALPSVGSVRPLLCANQSLFPSFSQGFSSWSMSSRLRSKTGEDCKLRNLI